VAVLVDTSILYALTDRAEAAHVRARAALAAEAEAVIVPQAVLPEICYLVNSRLGADAEIAFLRGLSASDWRVEPLTARDLDRSGDLLEAYRSADIGFVDAALIATAERLGVTRIYTLDRRDFGLVRPAHAAAFELLP
jgi:predicted nucleic acid-binding protein